MTALQSLFKAALLESTPIEVLVGRLNASLEALDEMNHGIELYRERGLITPVLAGVVGVDRNTVSMEGVQIHLNSSQVQAVIDFIKKWVPILIQKIREYSRQVMDWVRDKLSALDGKIKALKERLRTFSGSLVLENNGINGPALYLVTTPSAINDLGNYNVLDKLLATCETLVGEVSGDQHTPRAYYTGLLNLYSQELVNWLTVGAGLTFDAESNAVVRRLLDLHQTSAVENMPPATEVARLYQHHLDNKSKNISKQRLSSSEVGALLSKLEQVQLQLFSGVRKVNDRLKDLEKSLGGYVKDAEMYAASGEGATSLHVKKTVLKLVTYSISASSEGMRARLRILGSVVGALDKSV